MTGTGAAGTDTAGLDEGAGTFLVSMSSLGRRSVGILAWIWGRLETAAGAKGEGAAEAEAVAAATAA